MDLPQEFLTRMKNMLGGEYEDFLSTYDEPRRFGLRVNTLKISVDEFVKLVPFHLKKIPWTDNGFYYEREDDPARHPFYYAGLYYLQEPSAMTPASILPVSTGEWVLDLCAAPGGKATALAAKLQGQGFLVANDISASRARALLKNLEVFGVTNSFVTNAAPAHLAEQFPEAFDKILVDAPCSGEGMFRKDIANARAWSLEKVESCAKIQREITGQAVEMLRPGGMLLYSTCTFSPEENEGTIDYLLKRYPEMELTDIPRQPGFMSGCLEFSGLSNWEDLDLSNREELRKCVRMFPHKLNGEGHFIALLRKKSGSNALYQQSICGAKVSCYEDATIAAKGIAANSKVIDNRGRKSRNPKGTLGDHTASGEDINVLQEFLKDTSIKWSMDKIEMHNGQAYFVGGIPEISGKLPFLRKGLYLGEVRRGRFEPAQSFAMALRKDEYVSVIDFEPNDGRVRRYLCGETVQVDDFQPTRSDGWQLVCVSGYPLGWAKLVNGTLKNKYHPGWRMPT